MSSENKIEIEVHLSSSPERVFAAWTTPADLEEWLADRAAVEGSVGGAYRLVTDGSDDMPGPHICSGSYSELVVGQRIVKSWRYEGPDPVDTVETMITVELAADTDGTRMRFRETGEGLDTDEDRAFAIDAWNGAFEALAALVDESES